MLPVLSKPVQLGYVVDDVYAAARVRFDFHDAWSWLGHYIAIYPPAPGARPSTRWFAWPPTDGTART